MSVLLNKSELKVDEIESVKLGLLSSKELSFKASMILSPNFREFISPDLGWPVFVVAPCRDFIYILPHEHKEFLGRLGRVVIDEYNNSGYPITKDVLEISDNGIKAILTFSEPNK